MTPEQRSKNASNARTARERTLLREVERLGKLLLLRSQRIDDMETAYQKTLDQFAGIQQSAATANDELAKVRFVAAAWRDEAMHQQERLVEERAKRLRDEKSQLPF